MLVQIKELQGNEKPVNVSSELTVLQLKEEIAKVFGLPVDKQRLMYKGKTLANDKSLMDYKVEEGSKVHLFRLNDGPDNQQSGFWGDLNGFLRRFFSPEDISKITDYMKRDLGDSIDCLSLDDIERIALSRLEQGKDQVKIC